MVNIPFYFSIFLLFTNLFSSFVRDLWLFRHNEEVMLQRSDLASGAGVPLRTWMLRCPQQIFDRHIEKYRKREEVLRPHSDIVDYLSSRLQCSKEYIQDMSLRHPRLLSINPPKLEKLLDHLFSAGYTAAQVRNYYNSYKIFISNDWL